LDAVRVHSRCLPFDKLKRSRNQGKGKSLCRTRRPSSKVTDRSCRSLNKMSFNPTPPPRTIKQQFVCTTECSVPKLSKTSDNVMLKLNNDLRSPSLLSRPSRRHVGVHFSHLDRYFTAVLSLGCSQAHRGAAQVQFCRTNHRSP
jgi:hypothetical protein